MKPLVVIPARGGSKGVPGKNIKYLNGKPLIKYTLDVAREVFEHNIICVSTDSEEIRNVVEAEGIDVPFLRPAHLATDQAGTYEVLLHAISFYESNGYTPDVLIVLQPTSPFRTKKNIIEALDSFKQSLDMVVSVKETMSNPYYVLKEENSQGYLESSKAGNFIRRQDCPKVYELNGAIYIINVESLKNEPISKMKRVKKYLMDDISSLDIDSPLDWMIAETYMKKKQNER